MRSAKHDIYGLAILRLRADLAIHAVLENTDFIQPSTISTALQYKRLQTGDQESFLEQASWVVCSKCCAELKAPSERIQTAP
jgi:hypothetical protein